MGGMFGAVSKRDCVMDLFFGTDYHSHLGTKRGGMCLYNQGKFDRTIHNIENSPFRTKFEKDAADMQGRMGIGSISDGEPQPLTVYNKHGVYAISTVGRINNKAVLVDMLLNSGKQQFLGSDKDNMNNTELFSALISTQDDILAGIEFAQNSIDGSMSVLIMTERGIYAARDKMGRTPLIIGKDSDGHCIASESFSFINLGYSRIKELGPGEVAFVNEDEIQVLKEAGKEMRICSFLWTYFGYTTSCYEGENVEKTRYRNGASLAFADDVDNMDMDYVAGVPDSGTAHALGYANASGIPYSRPLIKYTPTWPRSFMPQNQKARELIAKMKLIPVFEIINGKKFVLIDDSIVRGTQLSGTVEYLHDNGAEEIHVRSACPPIMYACKYLNFSRTVNPAELITRRVIAEMENISPDELTEETVKIYANPENEEYRKMVEIIRKKLKFNSLKYQNLDSTLEAIGVDKCKLCTYCWNGKE